MNVTAPATTITLNPVADAYVDGSKPGSKFGTATTLRADASPDLRSYLRFTVSGLSGNVTRATLRLYSNSAHSSGYRIHTVADGTRSEASLTYVNAPPFDPIVRATSGALVAGTWRDLDLTSLITGNGTYDLAITTLSSTSLSLGSRESANPPQLVIEQAAP